MTRVRTTLTIDQEVIERYQAIAQVQGESLSSAVSNWLKFSVESAELVALELNRIKASLNPTRSAEEVAETLKVIRERYADIRFTVNGEDLSPGRGAPPAGGGAPAEGRIARPPVGNTGGKGTSPSSSSPTSRRSAGRS